MSKFHPLYDRVLVRRREADAKTPGGLYVPDGAKEKPTEADVIEVGQGKRIEDGTFLALSVKAGDRVLFGKYNGTEIKIEGVDHVILREEEILGVFR